MSNGTSSAVQPYDFRGNQVRVIMIDGKPWFMAADVCAVLEIGNVTMAMGRLDDDEYQQVSATFSSTEGGGPARYVVNQSGLYSLVLGSRKPEAREFKRWVTREVLPQIERTGVYLPVVLDPALQRIVDLTIEMQVTKNEQERLSKRQDEQAREIAAVAADVVDLKAVSPLADTTALHTLRDVAHACDTGQNRLSQWLKSTGVLFLDHQGYWRVKQHPWVEAGWAVDRWERWQNGMGWAWVTYFTPSGLLEVQRRWRAQ